MRSAAVCVTASYGDSIFRVVLFGESSVVSETHSDEVLGMYDVRHL